MVKLLQRDKRELLKILRQERSESRCAIVRELKKQAHELTEDLNPSIKVLEAEIEKLKRQLGEFVEARDQRLADNKLLVYNFENYSCRTYEMHPKLTAFDEETRIKEREILFIDTK